MLRREIVAARALVLVAACGSGWCARASAQTDEGVGQTDARSEAQRAAEGERAARRIGLQELLAIADEQAPSIRIAIAELARGEAAREAAWPDLPANPELEIGAGPRVSGGTVDTDAVVSISQRLEIAGEPGLRRAAAARVADRTEAELAQARWEVHWQVHQAYHLALVARERAYALDRVLAFAHDLLRITEQRRLAGEASPLDVRLAGVDVAQAQQAATQAWQEYVSARLSLAELSGLPIDPLPEPVGGLDPPALSPPLARLVELAREGSPALRVLEARLGQAEARRELEEREVWPEPLVGVQYSREGSSGPGSPPSDSVTGFVSIPFPFFQQNQGPRAEARAEVAIAAAEIDAFTARLAARIARQATAVDAAARRVALYGTEILPAFEESLTMLRRGFELGELSILDVAVARERFLRLQQDAVGAYADYHRALAELESQAGVEVMEDPAHGLDAEGGR